MADILSRMLDAQGNTIANMKRKFEELNGTLQRPYKLVEPNADVWNLVDWIQHVKHAFDELSEITLFSDSKFLTGLRGGATSMRQQLLNLKGSNSCAQRAGESEALGMMPVASDNWRVDTIKGAVMQYAI